MRPEGQPLPEATARLAWLLNEARQRHVTGVDLKDESVPEVPALDTSRSFLLGG